MKYQFCIRFKNIDANSAASKAVLDCNTILSKMGYEDLTFTVADNSNKLTYYLLLFTELVKLYARVKPNSIVAIQYPLLSINQVFKYLIKILKRKGVSFYCVVHDLESLRTGQANSISVGAEAGNLNYFDAIIVHNSTMGEWLKAAGVTTKMVELEVFDYLLTNPGMPRHSANDAFVFAGNLAKSSFIYELDQLKPEKFKVYGPGLRKDKPLSSNVNWLGEYSPDEVPKVMSGSFGLLWDGSAIAQLDGVLGNYLRYNNPHKFSLYIASGLPVIAPKDSAIGMVISKYQIGLLVNNLHELKSMKVSDEQYQAMLVNVSLLRKKVISGTFFAAAAGIIEDIINPK